MNTLSSKGMLGKGIGVPIAPMIDGKLPWVEGPEKVRQSIAIILDTEPGERIMLPSFGCGLRRFLMQPNTTATHAQMQREIERSLRSWEPRISVDSVKCLAGDDPAMVIVDIQYTHLRDGRRDNFVYPLYLE
ncbi:MAG: GPW/gp25 family protein [Kovacikia sp.]